LFQATPASSLPFPGWMRFSDAIALPFESLMTRWAEYCQFPDQIAFKGSTLETDSVSFLSDTFHQSRSEGAACF
jgi:hypothetical protein